METGKGRSVSQSYLHQRNIWGKLFNPSILAPHAPPSVLKPPPPAVMVTQSGDRQLSLEPDGTKFPHASPNLRENHHAGAFLGFSHMEVTVAEVPAAGVCPDASLTGGTGHLNALAHPSPRGHGVLTGCQATISLWIT